MREERLTGIDATEAVLLLLQRIRSIHPTKGLYEAADFQWSWGQAVRHTDDVEQLVWFDDDDRPSGGIVHHVVARSHRIRSDRAS